MMLVYFAVIVLATVQAADEKCDGVSINGLMYTKEVIKPNLDSPYQFTIDYTTNTLFFSYSTQNKDERFKLAYLDLVSKEFNVVPGIKDGFASAVDQATGKVFLGAKGGVYSFNLKAKQANLLQPTNQNIWQMFYKDGLYYSTYPKEEAYFIKDGASNRVEELKETRAMLIALDENKNMYFSNSSGLFKYNKSIKEILPLGDNVVNGMNSDVNDEIYFTSPNGIFKINDKFNTVERLVTLDNVYAAAIEKDGNILCGTDEGVVRFKKIDKCHL